MNDARKAAEKAVLLANIELAKLILPDVIATAAIVNEETSGLVKRLEKMLPNTPEGSEFRTWIGNELDMTKNFRAYLEREQKRLADMIKLGEKEE